MRSHNDLFGAFDSVDSESVDPDEMLARVHTGRAALQTARRRRVAVVSVAAAAILIAVGAIVIPSLGTDRPDEGGVASTPPPPVEQSPATQSLLPTEIAFSAGPLPTDYSSTYAGSDPGVQFLEISLPSGGNASDVSQRPGTIRVVLFDPVVSGQPAPVPSDEAIVVDSVTEGPLAMQVTHAAESPFAMGPWLQLAVQTDSGLWFVVLAEWARDEIPQEVLDVTARIDLDTPQPFLFPFQLGYVPGGVALLGAQGEVSLDGTLAGDLLLGELNPTNNTTPVLTVSAIQREDVPFGSAPNTTVGPYAAELTSLEGSTVLSVYNVAGFMMNLEVSPGHEGLLDEAELRRIAESIVVIPGAANDTTVWTDQPLG